ncbi:hypothetical protein GQ53DRAFT_672033 [Thozetella sp. PMI_491]|nr:hypothetical protein GQ53DRAFT_672033 [Thozetella sp. PMI_491]
MRFLCLHGMGTSGLIFKSQTVAFRSKLDKSFQFDFVDAPFESAPAPGIQVLFRSANYTWWPEPTINGVRRAHKWLTDYIEANGPYDAVCCFSQGCSLISTFLLYHYREKPHEPLPFKAALFICGGVPLQVLEDLQLPVTQKAWEIYEDTSKLLTKKAGALAKWAANPEMIKPGVGLWESTEDLLHHPDIRPNDSDVFGLNFTQFPQDIRIKIPTVHVYGAKDPRWPHGVQLARFCDNRREFDHGGGHDIPRSTDVSLAIAELVRHLEQQINNS